MHSGPLPNRIININIKNKILSDSWHQIPTTNIPVDKCNKRLENHYRKTNTIVLLLISKLIKICTLCTSHCYFQHNITFYKQKFSLSMGSLPLVVFSHTFILNSLNLILLNR